MNTRHQKTLSAIFKTPIPTSLEQKEAKPYQIRDARKFLEQAGIKP